MKSLLGSCVTISLVLLLCGDFSLSSAGKWLETGHCNWVTLSFLPPCLLISVIFPSERERRQGEEEEGGDTSVAASCQLECPRGRDGRDGVRGEKGERGSIGTPGEKGDRGPQGLSPARGGLYVRWGRASCPSLNGTELVYSGFTVISDYGTDFMCFPNDPAYSSSSAQGTRTLYAVEYYTHPAGLRHHNPPCAVCYSSLRATVMMIPAKLTCPPRWTSEYTGYLMTEDTLHTQHACVDQNPAFIHGTSQNLGSYEFFALKAGCNNNDGFPCPPYSSNKAVTCVVCTR